IRWFSRHPQISVSRPVALTAKSGEDLALIFRYKSKASAAASNAGPRLAEVAGNSSCSERTVVLFVREAILTLTRRLFRNLPAHAVQHPRSRQERWDLGVRLLALRHLW